MNWKKLVFLQEISSKPSHQRFFLNINWSYYYYILVVDKKRNSNNFFVPNAFFIRISHFNDLWRLYGYPEYKWNGCLLSQPFLLVPIPIRKGDISNKVFVLLISKCSAFFLYLNMVFSRDPTKKPIGLIFRSMLKLTIKASEVASIEDTRQKELIVLPPQTSPSPSVGFFSLLGFFYPAIHFFCKT